MNKRKNIFLLLATAVCATIFMAGCKKVGDPDNRIIGSDGGTTVYKDVPTRITYFKIEFTSDMAPVVYEFTKEDENYFFSSKFIYGDDDKRKVNKGIFDMLSLCVDEHNVKSWDGYNKSMDGVFDGEGFILNVTLSTGETIYATGYMSYPSGYDAFESSLMKVISEATKSVLTNSNI